MCIALQGDGKITIHIEENGYQTDGVSAYRQYGS
ncbi:MAG: hypothetical protein ETSY2_13400 [Candidatus Entotheonella gemina]|uniref:Uncharacterized protein n=1 Tax=Candidatus Entotheonella gemina TaxID=1429439 RepID=W4MAW3_9BACT|nr:MAG: hypothetical protein ETSY2_13400 [Candidatus Entotheonella gemina]